MHKPWILRGLALGLALGTTEFASAQTVPEAPKARSGTRPKRLAKSEVLRQSVTDSSANIQQYIDDGDLPRARQELEKQEQAVADLKREAEQPPDQTPPAAQPETNVAADEDKAEKAHEAAKADVATAEGNAGCDAQYRFCVFAGAAAASYSLTLGNGRRQGETSHHIVSLVVPTLGVRYSASRFISLDLAAYTAIISPELQVNSTDRKGTSCSTTGGTFEDSLPCEGNAQLRPYLAGFLGGTVGTGNSSLGLVSAGFTAGVARTTQDA
ncbi:MAG TPA: hypothetical protein VFV94_01250, partial [Polyangiaceae bacterium]|nr:hypothetical protein [Polyangiaceae bacterium]